MSNNTDDSSPFVFSPSQEWDGNDGSWSTFILRIGTPAQTFRVLPSTAGQETFVPVPEGCTTDDPQNCGDLRGVYPFQGQQNGFHTNESSTWKLIGLYDLVLESNLNYTGNGEYGLETVGLEVDNGIVLDQQVVAGIATKDFYLGIFGLGIKPSNFSDFQNPQPSFMQTLRNEKKIPSLSYGYTAGAPYRIPKALGSLTIGGYDQSRLTPSANYTSFPFGPDDSRSLSVGIQGITASNTLKGTVTLSSSSSPTFALIDSTVPHLWLPRPVCDQFEQAFGLVYDPHTDLYLMNDTFKHDQLKGSSLTFALGNNNDPDSLIQISLPFSAFDLQASYPIYPNATSYFPIRRASNDTQYTLGRTFLQEVYIVVDYERSNFSVYQTLFQSGTPQTSDIVTISSPTLKGANSPSPSHGSSKTSSGLGGGAIAGLVTGVIIALILTAALIMLFIRRRRSRLEPLEPHELGSNNSVPIQPDIHAHKDATEAAGEERYEMPNSKDHKPQIPVEMETPQIREPQQYFEMPSKSDNPVELEGDIGIFLMSDDAEKRRHELPAPEKSGEIYNGPR